jgi:hypothetical protein
MVEEWLPKSDSSPAKGSGVECGVWDGRVDVNWPSTITS